MDKIEKLHHDFFNELLNLSLGFHKDLRGRIDTSFIEIGIKNPKKPEVYWSSDWCSEITIYSSSAFFGKREPDINFGSSGSFTPQDLAQYWRTKHACIVLDNWSLIISIVEKYCQKIKEINT